MESATSLTSPGGKSAGSLKNSSVNSSMDPGSHLFTVIVPTKISVTWGRIEVEGRWIVGGCEAGKVEE
ncbi:MAG: hypothetical protein ACYC3X_21900 [Pirellulaceae bacterium]